MHIKGARRQGHTEAPGGRAGQTHNGRHVSTGDEEQALRRTFGGGKWLKTRGKTGG